MQWARWEGKPTINRYQGNSGRFTRIEEKDRAATKPVHDYKAPVHSAMDAESKAEVKSPYPHSQGQIRRSGIFEKLSKLISGGAPQLSQLETEDIILLLILYLMYRESGDSELLMIMGAMFLM